MGLNSLRRPPMHHERPGRETNRMNDSNPSAEKSPAADVAGDDVSRLRSFLANGQLVHSYLSKEFFSQTISPSSTASKDANDLTTLNFVDLAASLAMICCGVTPLVSDEAEDDGLACVGDNSISALTDHDIQTKRLQLAAEIGGGRHQEDGPIKNSSGSGVVKQDISFHRRHILM